jgi:hypothetical protein
VITKYPTDQQVAVSALHNIADVCMTNQPRSSFYSSNASKNGTCLMSYSLSAVVGSAVEVRSKPACSSTQTISMLVGHQGPRQVPFLAIKYMHVDRGSLKHICTN